MKLRIKSREAHWRVCVSQLPHLHYFHRFSVETSIQVNNISFRHYTSSKLPSRLPLQLFHEMRLAPQDVETPNHTK